MKARSHVLVVGAGPAGLAAAVRARESACSVTVLDDNPGPGGQIWRGGGAAAGSQANRWFIAVRNLDITTISGATVIAADTHSALMETPEGFHELRFRKLILATGSRELFLPFPGWTLPGVMGAGALQALVKSGMPVEGKSIVVAGSGPLLLASAAYLRQHGAKVRLIAEQASGAAVASFLAVLGMQPAKLLQALRLRAALARSSYHVDCWVEAAEGEGKVERVHLRSGGRSWSEPCDYAAVSYGLYPNTELAALVGCAIDATGIRVDELQQSTVEDVFCAGECTGIGGVDVALIEGEIAGYAAADDVERARPLFPARKRRQRFAVSLNKAFRLRPEVMQLARRDTIVCRCEDVRFEQLDPFESFRAAKLHTRCGMGSCQGRICGTAARFLFGWTGESVRPPIFPASVAAFAAGDGTLQSEEETKET
jgi:NADPH-dependent 2,4-dienoyl-CoA reductase/sulfur reductase-like enzyme